MKVTVDFKSSWIYDPSGINSFAISKLVSACQKEFGQKLSVENKSFTDATFAIEGALGSAEVARLMQEIIEKDVSRGKSWSEICTITVDGAAAPASAQPAAAQPAASSAAPSPATAQPTSAQPMPAVRPVIIRKDGSPATQAASTPATGASATSAPATGTPAGSASAQPFAAAGAEAAPTTPAASTAVASSVLSEIDKLVAAADFKELCQEIQRKAGFIRSRGTSKAFLSTALLFSISSGCGLTKALTLLNELLIEQGILEQGAPIKEISLPDPGKSDIHERLNNMVGTLEHVVAKPGVLCVDIKEWTSKTTDPHFKGFLLWLFRNAGNCLIVLRVPYMGEDRLKQAHADISDILSVRSVVFHPFDPVDLRDLAGRTLSEYGFSMTDEAWRIFDKRMEAERQDGSFYGIHTTNKVANELLRCAEGDASIVEGGSSLITEHTLAPLVVEEDTDLVQGFDRFNDLIGMDSIKQQMMEVVNQIMVSKSNPAISRPSMHMRFVGNPGTGKTTVARILGEVLRELGVLRIGRFYEHKARDLCGRYIGETAPKTTAICQEAYGSILFLDEAYALYRGDDNNKDYGREAIDTLITEMENNSDDIIVIMAGYPDDMEKLMDANAGLRSRMPYTITFPNYTRGQLHEIFMRMVSKAFKYTPEMEERSKEYFMSLPSEMLQQKSFGNARFVRNLFERVWGKAAMRCRSQEAEIIIDVEDFDAALGTLDNTEPVKKGGSGKIGFI